MTTSISVLILEDRAADAELIIHEIRRGDFAVEWRRVETESDFLAALDDSYDLIIADYALPHFDGLTALHLLRQRGLGIPFILVSGVIDEELAVSALKEGAADYLNKDRLGRLGVAVARALEDRKLREEKMRADARLVYLTHHDVMTGLYNRAFFEEELERLERGRQYPISIIVADIDQLKPVNDTKGHAAGDALIRSASQAFISAFRADDIVARIGGDELAALLPQAGESVAKKIIARIHDAIAEFNSTHQDSAISMSIGVSTAEEKTSLDETLRQADAAMYREKISRGSVRYSQ